MKISELISKFQKWTAKIVSFRTDNTEAARRWVVKGIEYDGTLDIPGYQKFFDRKEQNEDYVKRYGTEDPATRISYAHLQTEINMIASFHKCFAIRQKTRLQYYRDDLAQKDYHTYSAVNITLGRFLAKKNKAETK